MPVQDGLQASGTVTATTTGATAVILPFRATGLQIIAATSGGCFVDLTGGVGVLATTSASYPMAPSEVLRSPLSGLRGRDSGYCTGFSVLAIPGTTSTVRYIALT